MVLWYNKYKYKNKYFSTPQAQNGNVEAYEYMAREFNFLKIEKVVLVLFYFVKKEVQHEC